MADYDREAGTVTVIYQIVGAGTMELNTLNAGDCLHDLVGPLGTSTRTEGLKKVCIVGGGVGCAIAYPVAKKLHGLGCTVHLSLIHILQTDVGAFSALHPAPGMIQSIYCKHRERSILIHE